MLGGVTVALLGTDPHGIYTVVTGAGPGGGPHVKVWQVGNPPTFQQSFFAFDPGFLGGVFVG